ncbi:PREDICTED: basic proline-rich protein-like [Rhagoletis zephyria]|uniref:basic proline-rich protein-like n=1 Tax=Rhagoletis zephyria TaxID=28612 RepID=UPI0008119664|nr:PREDICTED: basic proline-rich protein-like [Rhagoletis zephyria]
MARVVKVNCASVAIFAILLLSENFGCSEAKRVLTSNNRKTGGGRTSSSGHVTKPSYPTQSSNGASNSHADLAKLSYSGYNSAPNRPASAAGSGATNSQPIGWNVPKSQGPPPSYSASNPAGGAHTNMHEAPPAYRPNNAAPPSYGSATNVHTPISATNTHGVQSSYPGATYHSPGALPAGATYYSSPGQLPAGASYHSPGSLPPGATYYPSSGHMPVGGGYYPSGGHMPAGGGYYPAGGGVPAGATYVAPGAALPPGAVMYSSPPQQTSSGLGFGSGLAAGAIGGAILGHVLTPTNTRVVESAPAAAAGQSGNNDDKIIIINNGPPGSVTTTNAGGATVITTGVAGENGTQPAAVPAPVPAPGAAPADPAIPHVPLAPMGDNIAAQATNGTTEQPAAPAPAGEQPAPAPAGEQPPPGGIICVPVRINETDPADNSKMIEVEKIACYPAPPPPPPAGTGAEMNGTVPMMPPADAGSAPLAPLSPVTAASQQLQASPTQAPLMPDNTSGGTSGAAWVNYAHCNSFAAMLLPLMIAFFGMR